MMWPWYSDSSCGSPATFTAAWSVWSDCCSIPCASCRNLTSSSLCSSGVMSLSFLRSTDPWQGIPDEQVHHTPAAEGRLDEDHPRRLRLHLADLGRLRAAGRASHRGERVVRGLGSDEGDERALVGDVHRVDAEDLARACDR